MAISLDNDFIGSVECSQGLRHILETTSASSAQRYIKNLH